MARFNGGEKGFIETPSARPQTFSWQYRGAAPAPEFHETRAFEDRRLAVAEDS